MNPPTLELRKWARAGDAVLFHIYIGDSRVGTGSMRSRDWFEVERGNFTVSVLKRVEVK